MSGPLSNIFGGNADTATSPEDSKAEVPASTLDQGDAAQGDKAQDDQPAQGQAPAGDGPSDHWLEPQSGGASDGGFDADG
jgi:hypothetical protein